MLVCNGIKFKNAADLFEYPGCYVSTLAILRNRLRILSPEKAIVPKSIRFLGKNYKSIYRLAILHQITPSVLYRRMGFIYKGRKVTAEQALSVGVWSRLKCLKRAGKFNTILLP